MIHRRSLLTAAAFGPLMPALARAALPEPDHWDEAFDVVVVGSGGAGLAAAVEAGEAGAKTLVLEKMSVVGGNTRITGAGFNAVDPAEQKKLGICDSPELHMRQTLAAGDYRARPELVRVLADEAPGTLAWLKARGVEFRPGVYQIYGGLYPRGHAPVKPAGMGYIDALTAACASSGTAIRLDTKVEALVTDKEGAVLGVQVRTKRGRTRLIRAERGVVVATGGFSANTALCALFDPRLSELTTTNHKGATGDMIAPLLGTGAAFVGMDFVQCVPGLVKGDKHRTSFVHKAERFIFVNAEGKRFIAEDGRRSDLCDAVLNQPSQLCFPVIDQDGMDALPPGQRANCEAALNAGEAYSAPTLEALAKLMKVPEENFRAAVEQYNRAVDEKNDPLFGRKLLVCKIEKPPFYAGRNSMSTHYTMGGVLIDPQARVLDWEGNPVRGLYAAGEVTGGVHGTNRAGGNAVAEIFVFGRIAGVSAAKRA